MSSIRASVDAFQTEIFWARVEATKSISANICLYELCGQLFPISDDFLKPGINDFSTVTSCINTKDFIFLGPVAFLNHDCEPNVQWYSRTKRLSCVKTVCHIQKGHELTVYYGRDFFGTGNCECQCVTCEKNDAGFFSKASSIDDKLPLKVKVSHKTKTVMNVDEQNDDESTKVNSFTILESSTDVKELPPTGGNNEIDSCDKNDGGDADDGDDVSNSTTNDGLQSFHTDASSIDDELPLKVNVSHKTKTDMNADEQNDDQSTNVNSLTILESATGVKELAPTGAGELALTELAGMDELTTRVLERDDTALYSKG
ncbi:histone-lysine N-methyltransferase KMT5B-A-like [Acyrthosiphon pisum]|uniref:SET domain-containing protein n=1 Tax=Acyrthosiphon pisum TaxID=7029 RepID=A0A8R2F6L5_ACYPI|nr:histone-lysine N-methyltransferase KMT5B-A-like [Acyrthosiphon pisum]|eukprot:XP_008180959.1 PREDICTED: histone-lysine N-methyltransferase KMT5B-A-like [Acyrthosiphon pisum]